MIRNEDRRRVLEALFADEPIAHDASLIEFVIIDDKYWIATIVLNRLHVDPDDEDAISVLALVIKQLLPAIQVHSKFIRDCVSDSDSDAEIENRWNKLIENLCPDESPSSELLWPDSDDTAGKIAELVDQAWQATITPEELNQRFGSLLDDNDWLMEAQSFHRTRYALRRSRDILSDSGDEAIDLDANRIIEIATDLSDPEKARQFVNTVNIAELIAKANADDRESLLTVHSSSEDRKFFAAPLVGPNAVHWRFEMSLFDQDTWMLMMQFWNLGELGLERTPSSSVRFRHVTGIWESSFKLGDEYRIRRAAQGAPAIQNDSSPIIIELSPGEDRCELMVNWRF